MKWWNDRGQLDLFWSSHECASGDLANLWKKACGSRWRFFVLRKLADILGSLDRFFVFFSPCFRHFNVVVFVFLSRGWFCADGFEGTAMKSCSHDATCRISSRHGLKPGGFVVILLSYCISSYKNVEICYSEWAMLTLRLILPSPPHHQLFHHRPPTYASYSPNVLPNYIS